MADLIQRKFLDECVATAIDSCEYNKVTKGNVYKILDVIESVGHDDDLALVFVDDAGEENTLTQDMFDVRHEGKEITFS